MSEDLPGKELTDLDLSIDADGMWRHEGVEITHERVVAFLFKHLEKHGEAHFVCAEGLCKPVQVADCPFVVLAVRHNDDGIALTLTDGSSRMLDPESLTIDPESIPRCVVAEDGSTARFSRSAWMQLAEAIDVDEAGNYVISVAGESHPVRQIEKR